MRRFWMVATATAALLAVPQSFAASASPAYPPGTILFLQVGWNLRALGDGVTTIADINREAPCVDAIWQYAGGAWYGWFPNQPSDTPRAIAADRPLFSDLGYWVHCAGGTR